MIGTSTNRANTAANKDAIVGYINYSIYLPDPALLRRVKAAAKEQKLSPGAVFRLAAEQYVTQHEKKRSKKQQTRAA